jgi:hypothetical protein
MAFKLTAKPTRRVQPRTTTGVTVYGPGGVVVDPEGNAAELRALGRPERPESYERDIDLANAARQRDGVDLTEYLRQHAPATADFRLSGNDSSISGLGGALVAAQSASVHFPKMLEHALISGSWRERTIEGSTMYGIVRFKSFVEFVERYPRAGLGSTIAELKRLCRDNQKVLDLIDRQLERDSRLNQP